MSLNRRKHKIRYINREIGGGEDYENALAVLIVSCKDYWGLSVMLILAIE